MMNIYISKDKSLVDIEEIVDGCWVNLINPSEKEIEYVSNSLKIESDFINAGLDEEERSRIELDDETGNLLIVIDMPVCEIEKDSRIYTTFPIAIIFTKEAIVTICLKESVLIKSFSDGRTKTFFTYKKSRFVLQILHKNATLFLQFLRQIEKHSNIVKSEIHKSMRNKEIIQLLDLENSLVYFNTSLKSNELVMEKLLRYDFIKKYPEDTELLEDTIIENKQAIEMAKIYSDILGGTMDAFASIISNNLNIVMKFLTSVTIIMAVPQTIFSFFGQNVYWPFENLKSASLIILVLTLFICAVMAYVMNKRKMF